MLNQLLQKAQHFFLPYSCIFCGIRCKTGVYICVECLEYLPWSKQACQRCGIQLNDPVTLCGQCLKQPPFFDKTLALFNYQHPVDRLVVSLKFHNKLVYANLLSKLFLEKIRENYAGKTLPGIIIPVPLHPKRLKERGFNQALELAKPIARQLNIPFDLHSCQRIRATETQSLIPAEKRRSNMQDAFIVNKNFATKHVAILDDVMTTGHTVNELAKSLQKIKVEKIDVWCVARAMPKI